VSIAELAANPVAIAVVEAGVEAQLGSVAELTEDAVAAELGSAHWDFASLMLAASGLDDRVVRAVRPVLGCFAASSRAASPDDAVVLGLVAAVPEPEPEPVAAELAVVVVVVVAAAAAAVVVGLAVAAS
jgi:hypothetical protein